MLIFNHNFTLLSCFQNEITVPDCFVVAKNKIGSGHGEAKLYISSKDELSSFFNTKEIKCLMFRRDLINYLLALELEYKNPSQPYRGSEELPSLWIERMKLVKTLPEVILFTATDQSQIQGVRGYLNSSDKYYQIIREIALPLVSFIRIQLLQTDNNIELFYWRLYADFDAIADKKTALVFNYGKGELLEDCSIQKGNNKNIVAENGIKYSQARDGQDVFRKALLDEAPICPITKITTTALLIASHIKPWAISNEIERVDHFNGFLFSPLYDKLFDKGFITFTNNKEMIISPYLQKTEVSRMGLKEHERYPLLPITDERKNYLDFHRNNVYKG